LLQVPKLNGAGCVKAVMSNHSVRSREKISNRLLTRAARNEVLVVFQSVTEPRP
jgi:hypothetical protein